MICINYICTACGYTWEDRFRLDGYDYAPTCHCPSCEEPVLGAIKD